MHTEQAVLKMLRAESNRLGSQLKLAAAIGITTAQLSNILSGKRTLGKAVQKYLGIRRRIVYERVKP